jgi:outer membrane protein W
MIRKTTQLYSALLAIGGSALAALPAQAQESTSYDFKLFGGASYVSPLSDSSLAGIADSVEASSEFGWEIGAEWKPTDRLGLEVAYLDATHDVEANGTAIGDISLRPWNFSLNFHLVDRDRFNWWVGPTVSYIDWSEIELNGGASLDVDSETTYGVSTGMSIGLGDTFALQFGLRYLDASVESPSLPDDVSVDPLFVNMGVAFRF